MFVVWCLKDCRFCMKSYDVGFKLKQQVKVFHMIICVQFGGVFEDHYKLFFWLIDLFMFGFIYMIVASGYYKFEYILVNGWIKKTGWDSVLYIDKVKEVLRRAHQRIRNMFWFMTDDSCGSMVFSLCFVWRCS